MIEARARADRTDPSDQAEPIENAEAKDPIDATDSADPIDPMDSTEPLEPIDSSESSDHSDHFDVPGRAGNAQILSLGRRCPDAGLLPAADAHARPAVAGRRHLDATRYLAVCGAVLSSSPERVGRRAPPP